MSAGDIEKLVEDEDVTFNIFVNDSNTSEKSAPTNSTLKSSSHISSTLTNKRNTAAMNNKIPQDHTLKIIVVGDFSVGKTVTVRRYTEQEFEKGYKVTIGSDFAYKLMKYDEFNFVRIHFWDIAGQERNAMVTRQFYKNSHAIILVFDISRKKTFQRLPMWIENLKSSVLQFDGSPVPIILFANKCDLPNQDITTEILNEFCQSHKLDAWYLTSSKEYVNIEEGMKFTIKRALEVKKKNDVDSMLNPIPEEVKSQTITLAALSARYQRTPCCTKI